MSLPTPPGSHAASVANNRGTESSIRYDDEQLAVIACDAKNVVVEASAGAGKTSTAIGFAKERPTSHFLYLCFGKANQLEAQARFTSLPNVECRTTHSLAYAGVGYKYAKANQVAFNWSPREFASQLRLNDVRTAAVLQGILNQYFVSTDSKISIDHTLCVADKWEIDANEVESLTDQAALAWQKMRLIGSGVSIPPDAYLKLWALSNPKLNKYQHIILDEAQDTNPVTAKIVSEQTHAKTLLIGDKHQSIFLFRGALNAMETFAAGGGTVLNMPRTWRFGPEIAGHANTLLRFFKNEQVKIIGAGPGKSDPNQKKIAVLSRTNVGLFESAAEVMGKNTHWMGGIEGYKIDSINDAYLLKTGRKSEIKDASIRNYGSWSLFVDEAKNTKDAAARVMISLLEKYGRDIPYLIKCFRGNALPSEVGASLVLSTAHKAKGMEWDRVKIGEDFDCVGKSLDSMMLNPTAELTPEQVQEINLMYVAITRGRQQVFLNKDTGDFLKNFIRINNDFKEALARSAVESADDGESNLAAAQMVPS